MTELSKQKKKQPHNNLNVRNSLKAANFNAKVLRKIQKTFQKDSKVDISTVLSNNYPLHQASKKIEKY